MGWQQLGLCVLVFLWLGGCATHNDFGQSDTLSVGQRETDLRARKGPPQEILEVPGKGKILVYTTIKMDQVAAMGGGVWAKPDQVYYWLDQQGVITRVVRYPYGKKRFLFPTEKEPAQIVQVSAPHKAVPPPQSTVTLETALHSPENSATKKIRQPANSLLSKPQAEPSPPSTSNATTANQAGIPHKTTVAQQSRMMAKTSEVTEALPVRSDIEGVTRLELDMTRDEVRNILGLPEKVDGFKARGKAVIIWSYTLKDTHGRPLSTPMVFENGRLSGWGETHYRRILGEVLSQ